MKNFAEFESRLNDISSAGIRPGLSRMARLLAALGHPERRIPAVHVVGTNGKGSTAAAIEAILEVAGLRTALYTSPHLVSIGERLRVVGSSPAFQTFVGAFERVASGIEGDERLSADPPTFFENFTAAAFLIVAEAGVDVAVFEAGMGGRLDATNMLSDVLCTVVTPIGLDHAEYLGDTVEAVADEKFAVLRRGVPAIFAGDARLDERFAARCALVGAKCAVLTDIASVGNVRCDLSGTSFDLVLGREGFLNLYTPLVGAHQARNAALAAMAVHALSAKIPAIDAGAIRRGIERTRWPGRFEVWRAGDGSPRIILDGAHNEHGVGALIESVRALEGSLCLGGIVFATMADKEISASLRMIASLGVPIYCTQIPGMGRSMTAPRLAEIARREGLSVAGEYADPLDALLAARAEGDVICCGSLYLVGYLTERRETVYDAEKS